MARLPMPLVYAARNVMARKTSTAVTTVAVSVSVMVFLVMSATAEGISRVATATGSASNLLVLSEGATSAEVSYLDRDALFRARELPGLQRDDAGQAEASVELVLPRAVRPDRGPADRVVAPRYVVMRGVTAAAFRIHDGVEIASGNYPRSPQEVLIGDVLARTLGGVRIGDSLVVGPRRYRVSGTLSARGQVFAGEIWADLEALQGETGQRGASVLVLRIDDGERVQSIAQQIASSRGLSVSARPEQDYYRDIQKAALPFVFLGNVIGLILGMGAVMAGMNTMYAAMSRRIRELGTLRALGFGRWYVGGSLLLESMLIGGLGGVLGSTLALGFDGFALNLMGLSFELTVESASLLRGAALALAVGTLGGLLPAQAALRLHIIESLRHN